MIIDRQSGVIILKLGKLSIIGIIAGILLAGCMKLIFLLTGNEAYQLLYNVDYIPLIKIYNDTAYFGVLFHYTFCIVSVIGLYYLLKFFRLHHKSWPYILVYTIGASVLFFLTLLTNQPPAANQFMSWFYWMASHLLYGITVGWLVKKWL